jgi:murein L,D-transpeptidase YcbB/YkuD
MVCINKGFREIAQEISVAMERQRWFTIPEKRPFILVNLAYFTTYLYYEDSIKTIDICIGKGLPPILEKGTQDMRTPQIYSKIHSVVINPTWSVPYSIVSKEMLPKLKRDPKYLERNNYLVYRNGESVSPDSIDWSKYSVNNIPFKIVQSPGRENALGKVKYLFHNPFSIYMHDTPIKSAFNLKTRAVSHGCVRLKEPLLFGEFVMQGSKKYTADEFRMNMGDAPNDEDLLKEWEKGDSTFLAKYKTDSIKSIWLENPIPVYFDYRTIFVDESNQTRIIHDVYGYNRKIWAAMRRE